MAGSQRKGRQKEDLGRYVNQVMNTKGLSARNVAERSGGKITGGYVTGIMKGVAANPSVDKIKALATGLGVDRYELFAIACGPDERTADRSQANEKLQALELLDLMKRAVVSPRLMKLVEQAVHMRPKELEAVLGSVDRFMEARQKARGKGKRR